MGWDTFSGQVDRSIPAKNDFALIHQDTSMVQKPTQERSEKNSSNGSQFPAEGIADRMMRDDIETHWCINFLIFLWFRLKAEVMLIVGRLRSLSRREKRQATLGFNGSLQIKAALLSKQILKNEMETMLTLRTTAPSRWPCHSFLQESNLNDHRTMSCFQLQLWLWA